MASSPFVQVASMLRSGSSARKVASPLSTTVWSSAMTRRMGMSGQRDPDVEACAARAGLDAERSAQRLDALGEHDGADAQPSAVGITVLAVEREATPIVDDAHVQLLVLLSHLDGDGG